jgi:hypothetical protein
MCSLVHVCDDDRRLEFMNSTQINQLELNPVINDKSEMFKGMSNKKRTAAIKKGTTKTDQREKRSCIKLHRSTIAAVLSVLFAPARNRVVKITCSYCEVVLRTVKNYKAHYSFS